MRFFTAIAAALLSFRPCVATPTPSALNYMVHEKRDANDFPDHPNVAKRSKLGINNLLPIRIGLVQADLHKGYDWLMDISHPASLNYGKYWTVAEVNKAFAPTAETVQAVRGWLLNSGIEPDRISVSDNKGWLAFDATVEEAEQLFRTQYYKHEHHDENKYTIGCDKYSLPADIRQHIDYITPGVNHQVYKRSNGVDLGMSKPTLLKAPPELPVNINAKTVPLNCSSHSVTADCIRALYQMPPLKIERTINPQNSFGIYESLLQSYSQADLNLFFAEFAPFIPKGTRPQLISVDGGLGPVSQNDSGGEAMLDFTLAFSLTYPQPLSFFSVDDNHWASNGNGYLDTLLDSIDGSFCTYSAFGQKGNNNTVDPVYPDPRQGGYKGPLQCGTYTPPKVLSVSYNNIENAVVPAYWQRQCNEFLKLALQGTTAVFSSGDSGVSSYGDYFDNTNGCTGPDSTIFTPSALSDCPYVLSVGATTIRPNVSGYSSNPEMAVYETFSTGLPYTSGGGFSNVFARPAYQDVAVKTYFRNYDPGYPFYKTTKGEDIGANGGIYNRIGRAYPDVSVNGAWWTMYVAGEEGRWGGTSMSAPIVASMLSLINEARLKAGKSTVGFVHPTLYANPDAFHDITIGANQGCGLDIAFNATPGWDPVTGLGTPNFRKLKAIFMALP